MPFILESLDTNPCYLTETELRRIHKRFGHPSVEKLYNVLYRAGHDIERKALEHLTKYCQHCQKHGKSPGRFKFSLQDDIDFNFNVIVEIMTINGKPILCIVDAATRFKPQNTWII